MFGIFGVHGVVGRTPETARNRIGTQWHNVGVQRNGKRHNGMSVGQWRLPMDNGDFRHPKEVYSHFQNKKGSLLATTIRTMVVAGVAYPNGLFFILKDALNYSRPTKSTLKSNLSQVNFNS